jgi:hypothetical protein
VEYDPLLSISVTVKSKSAITLFLDDTEKSESAYVLVALKITVKRNKVKSDFINNSI